MCVEIENYRENHENDFSSYFDLKQIDKDAEYLYHEIYKAMGKTQEKFDEPKTDIIGIARHMGFKIYYTDSLDEKISGIVGIADSLKEKYKSEKVIILNGKDSDEQMLFTIAHEVAHYIYDYRKEEAEYFNQYRIKERATDEEHRANRFAAAILMPSEKFNKEFRRTSDITTLANKFQVPLSSVRIRIDELGLNL